MAGIARRSALGALIAASVAIAAPAPAHADHPIPPDLITVKPAISEMNVVSRGKRTFLRIANRVGNQGEGPLEIRPSEDYTDCDGDGDATRELIGYQLIFDHEWIPGSDENTFTEEDIGCVVYHRVHTHWHVTSIARFALVDVRTKVSTFGRKVGFCLGDSGRIDGGSPNDGDFFAFSGCGSQNVLPTVTGISPGFFDLYGTNTPGQRVEVTGLRTGRYCLRSAADPEEKLTESDEANNAAELLIRLNPGRDVVRKVAPDCTI